jgi:hypothetical protein
MSSPVYRSVTAARAGRIMGAVMFYVVVPAGGPPGGSTRLIPKIVGAHPRWMAPSLCLSDLVMARRQLLRLQELAEHSTARSAD